MVNINSKSYDPEQGVWYVECNIVLLNGTRSGTETVELPEKATEAELKAAVLKAYS